jgi:hypothetical protein
MNMRSVLSASSRGQTQCLLAEKVNRDNYNIKMVAIIQFKT